MNQLLFGLNIDPSADKADNAFRLASLADEHGLDFVSVMDHPEQPRFLETWTLLVALAMRTERVAVMPNVANIPLRPPAMLAKAASSLAVLTGGRLILGVGAGDPHVVGPYGGPSLPPRGRRRRSGGGAAGHPGDLGHRAPAGHLRRPLLPPAGNPAWPRTFPTPFRCGSGHSDPGCCS